MKSNRSLYFLLDLLVLLMACSNKSKTIHYNDAVLLVDRIEIIDRFPPNCKVESNPESKYDCWTHKDGKQMVLVLFKVKKGDLITIAASLSQNLGEITIKDKNNTITESISAGSYKRVLYAIFDPEIMKSVYKIQFPGGQELDMHL